MKEDLVLIEAFSIIFNKVILSMNVEQIHLIILIKKYQSGSQQVFLIIQMILGTKTNLPGLKMMEAYMFIYKVIIFNKII